MDTDNEISAISETVLEELREMNGSIPNFLVAGVTILGGDWSIK